MRVMIIVMMMRVMMLMNTKYYILQLRFQYLCLILYLLSSFFNGITLYVQCKAYHIVMMIHMLMIVVIQMMIMIIEMMIVVMMKK